MPAGRMFLAAKAGRGRRRYKRRATSFKKAVSTIARKVVLRQAETKTGFATWNQSIGSNGVMYSVNGGGVFSSIQQGTAQQNRIGDEITVLGVKLRGHVLLEPAIITANREFSGFRMLVVSGKRPLTSGDMPGFRESIDPDRMTVISDRYYKLDSNNLAVFLNKYIKFKRHVKYSGSVAIKNDLYIWIVPAPLGTGLTTTTGYSIVVDMQPYFKDV